MNRALMILLLTGLPCTARAETRGIGVDVQLEKGTAVATVYSSDQNEQRSKVPIEEAVQVLRKARGWGSMVFVSIESHGVDPKLLIPLLDAISGNGMLQLGHFEAETGFEHPGMRRIAKQMITNGRKKNKPKDN